MKFPEVYLSKPAVVLPETRIDNDEILKKIRERYLGRVADLPVIEGIVRRTFDMCGSQYRYLETDPQVRIADYASRAAGACLKQNGVDPSEVDLLINGSIAREYFEPSTAMEVASNLGIDQVHAFDVTSACAGQLEAIHVACAHLNMNESMNTALVCSAELTRQFLTYDIHSIDELVSKVAGLTIGNAASAFLIRKEPFSGGCLRILGMRNHSLPQNWYLCSAPIDGTFTSISGELFKLNVHVAPELTRMLGAMDWSAEDIDHFVFHQPSEKMIRKVLSDLGADENRAVFTHHLYGNTSSTTVSLALDTLLSDKTIEHGDKMLLSTAASGFTMVTAAGQWNAA